MSSSVEIDDGWEEFFCTVVEFCVNHGIEILRPSSSIPARARRPQQPTPVSLPNLSRCVLFPRCEKYLEEQQVEDERNKPRVVDEYSIKNCIDPLKTMDITPEEEVKAFRVFKIPENREIFMSARPETALMWLRAEME